LPTSRGGHIPRRGGAAMSDHYDYEHHHVTNEPDRGSWTGYAAIKYTAIVIVVLAILAFLAWYIVPKIP
jgi:hypothetical protein